VSGHAPKVDFPLGDALQATIDALLALYGIPEPPPDTAIETLLSVLRTEAARLRATHVPPGLRPDYWTTR
jgi:hypothetical protein